jgi:hypothetical protein
MSLRLSNSKKLACVDEKSVSYLNVCDVTSVSSESLTRCIGDRGSPLDKKSGRSEATERSRFLPGRLKSWHAMLAISAMLSASVALSEDFKTVSGKLYKSATVSRIEGDGLVLKTEKGIYKVYFTELPPEVQERFHWAKPEAPREPFYSRFTAAAEDPAVLAKIIAAGTVIIAGVALVTNHIRSRRQQTTRATRASRRRGVQGTRS